MHIFTATLAFVIMCAPAIANDSGSTSVQAKKEHPPASDTVAPMSANNSLDGKINASDAFNQTIQAADNTDCIRKSTSGEWIDTVRASTHTRLCMTASWLDGLFGQEESFNGSDFIGKISLGFRHDEIEGFDPRLRVKVKTDLPNLSKRFNAYIGRVEEDSFISNTEVRNNRLNNVGLRSTDDEENEWLVGLGYRQPTSKSNGFDLSVGAKLSSGLSPYAKVAHRHMFVVSPNKYWQTTQTVFWREQDGFGVSSRAEFTNLVNDNNILVSQASVKYTEEEEQWEWFADTAWHHSISDKKGVSSTIYVRGEAESPASIPEYGMTFTYIRPFVRDWLSIETGVDLRWEREFPGAAYKSAVRFGIQFEMQLGNYYSRRKRLR